MRSVMADTTNGPMISERLNQIVAELAAIDSREAFVNESVQPLLDDPDPKGLNSRYAWLQLPVYFPHARAWTVGYYRLTGWHGLLVSSVMLLTLIILCCPRRYLQSLRWQAIAWGWVAAGLLQIVLLLLLFVM